MSTLGRTPPPAAADAGAPPAPKLGAAHRHAHDHGHDHAHDHGHDHAHGHGGHHDHGDGRGRTGWRPWAPWTLAGILIAAYALSGLRMIGPTQRGVVQRLGRALEVQVPPGIHLLWPMGIDRVTRVEMRRTRRVMVGIEAADRAMGNLPNPEISQFLTGDRNIVDIQLSVQYIIADPRQVLFAVDGVERAVANACESALNASASSLAVDDVLTRRRADIQRQVLAAAQSQLDAHGVGVQLLTATLERTSPPEAVADAFRAVTGARADRDRMVAEAQGYGEDLLPRTRGEAAGMLAAAAADAYAAETLATAEVRRFATLSRQAAQDPALVRRQLHLDAMEAVLSRTRTILVDPQRSGPVRIVEEAP